MEYWTIVIIYKCYYYVKQKYLNTLRIVGIGDIQYNLESYHMEHRFTWYKPYS
jgi:hypothetical protein